MQRDLHSIFTTRILLNLREAASRDRARRLQTRSETDAMLTRANHQSRERETRTAFSSVVIGVDMWFPDSEDGYAIQGDVPTAMV
jgi:hypothetical protein